MGGFFWFWSKKIMGICSWFFQFQYCMYNFTIQAVLRMAWRVVEGYAPADPGGPPKDFFFFKIMQFSGDVNSRQTPLFWANFRLTPPWGQNSAGSPVTEILDLPLMRLGRGSSHAMMRQDQLRVIPWGLSETGKQAWADPCRLLAWNPLCPCHLCWQGVT